MKKQTVDKTHLKQGDKTRKIKELHFVCNKCEHHLFVEEKLGWVKKVIQPCPECGEETEGYWSGNFALAGYGSYKKFISNQ